MSEQLEKINLLFSKTIDDTDIHNEFVSEKLLSISWFNSNLEINRLLLKLLTCCTRANSYLFDFFLYLKNGKRQKISPRLS